MTDARPLFVPLANPALDTAHQKTEILSAIEHVVESGAYVLGPRVSEFEERIAQQHAVSGAVGVASGTDALILALATVGVRPGDEVITVSHTAGPTVAAILSLGATPVLVDVDSQTHCLHTDALEGAISPRTKAVLPVHIYGHPADMDKILVAAGRWSVPIIEDCAQAHGARIGTRLVGSLGRMGCFSFYPTKNLGAVGDSGLLLASASRDVELARKLRMYGWTKPQYAEVSGGRCSRLDELQAAILLVKLNVFEAAIERRRAIAARYSEAFRDLPLKLPVELPGFRHAYHLYVIRSDRRVALAEHLEKDGIATGIHYPYPIHKQPAFAGAVRLAEEMNVTEEISTQILSIPLFTSITSDQQDHVIGSIRRFFGKR